MVILTTYSLIYPCWPFYSLIYRMIEHLELHRNYTSPQELTKTIGKYNGLTFTPSASFPRVLTPYRIAE